MIGELFRVWIHAESQATLPSSSRNALVSLASLIVVIGSGCGSFLDDNGTADTDSPNPKDGVYVGCQNLPAGGGADETGDGGAAVGDNFWWAAYDGPPLTSWQVCGPGVIDDVCCVEGIAGSVTCYQNEYAVCGSEIYGGGLGPICVNSSSDGGIDPLADWVDGGCPSIDAALRADCTARCENKLSPDGVPYNCQDSDWVAVRTYGDWNPSKGLGARVVAGRLHIRVRPGPPERTNRPQSAPRSALVHAAGIDGPHRATGWP